MKKKLFAIFGPVVLAIGLLVFLFISPYRVNVNDPKVIHEAASSMSGNLLKGDAIKNEALAEEKYVPFFGSSELSRISPFHPSVLAKKYQRDYEPFLLGAPGTQSFSQFMLMQSAGSHLKDKKAVFIISPQWFVKKGVSKDYFNMYYSELQTYDWLFGLKKVTSADRYVARRLLSFPKVTENQTLTELLQQIKAGRLPTEKSRKKLYPAWQLLKREDELFSQIGLVGKQKRIDHATGQLPEVYQDTQLKKLANKIGEKSTNNNPYGLKNEFYTHRVRPEIEKLKQSQTNWDYRCSPEFSDFQLVLEQFVKQKMQVMFIIPPVNEKWSDYTGLSQEMLQQFAKKVKFQLTSQGFEQVVDLTNQANTPYFMEDTIHLGWQGWLAADQKIAPFLAEKQAPVHYKLDNAFYSKEWQQKEPDKLN